LEARSAQVCVLQTSSQQVWLRRLSKLLRDAGNVMAEGPAVAERAELKGS
jgi:hypothetical protein